jgi:hypothetical protein
MCAVLIVGEEVLFVGAQGAYCQICQGMPELRAQCKSCSCSCSFYLYCYRGGVIAQKDLVFIV